jgi:hypothetical protein
MRGSQGYGIDSSNTRNPTGDLGAGAGYGSGSSGYSSTTGAAGTAGAGTTGTSMLGSYGYGVPSTMGNSTGNGRVRGWKQGQCWLRRRLSLPGL